MDEDEYDAYFDRLQRQYEQDRQLISEDVYKDLSDGLLSMRKFVAGRITRSKTFDLEIEKINGNEELRLIRSKRNFEKGEL